MSTLANRIQPWVKYRFVSNYFTPDSGVKE